MIDRIKLTLDRVFLRPEAVASRTTVDGYHRAHYLTGKSGGNSVILSFSVDGYSVVKIRAIRLKDDRWRVTTIDAILPALLHGHNGRPIRNGFEFHLALTILVHIARAVVEPHCHCRILPGLGSDNHGFVNYCECMIQALDPDHAFLIGSHLGRMRNQCKPTANYFGQSTRMSTREVAMSIYDKNAQLREGRPVPDGVAGTRIEAVVKDPKRLAMDAGFAKRGNGRAGEPVVATLAMFSAYGVLRKNVLRITGVGWLPDKTSLSALRKNTRIIAGALGDHIKDPGQVHLALEAYRLSCDPKPATFHKVEAELRAYATRVAVPDPLAIVPSDPAGIAWSEVHWSKRETEWAIRLRDIGAPTVPDPAITAAWSATTIIARPSDAELTGTVMPGALAFRNNTL